MALRELTQDDLDEAELIEVDEFSDLCLSGDMDDSDGYGLLVSDNEVHPDLEVSPSDFAEDPFFPGGEFTHVLWYGR